MDLKQFFLFRALDKRHRIDAAVLWVIVCIFFVSSWVSAPLAQAEVEPNPEHMQPMKAKLPRLEAGLGAGFFYLPDYPGSKESRLRFLPLPYVIYRGQVVRADRDGGVRTRFFSRDRFEVDLSFGAAFPVNGEDNDARKDMPDLDWMGEVGPRLVYHMISTPKHKLDFYLPVRYAFSTDFRDFDRRGFVFAPEFVYRKRSIFHRKMVSGLSVSPTWASEELMDYFYQVDPQFVTAERPAYNATGGYLVTNASIFTTYIPKPNYLFFTAISLNYYNEAQNRRSPLLNDHETESFIFGVVWKFYESKDLEEPLGPQ